MLEALVVSNMILWLLVIALAAVVAALVRQIGVLHERVAPVGALVGREGPRIGEMAPRFELTDWWGTPCTLGGPDPERKRTLLVFVSPSCPVCKTMLPILDSVQHAEGEGVRLVLASDGPRPEHEAFARTQMVGRRYVLSTQLGLTYQVGKLPHAVLIDADGVLRAKGLINTREHVESLFEAMERGVGSVQEYLRNRTTGREAESEGASV